MPSNSSTPSTRKQASSATPASKRQKKKQSVPVPDPPQDAPFSVAGYTEGVKLYSDDRSTGQKDLLSQHALEPRLAEVDASGVMSSRNLVDLSLAELAKLRTIGREFLTSPVALSLVQILCGFDEDVSTESFKAASALLMARDERLRLASAQNDSSLGSSSSSVRSSESDARFTDVAVAVGGSLVLYVGPDLALPPSEFTAECAAEKGRGCMIRHMAALKKVKPQGVSVAQVPKKIVNVNRNSTPTATVLQTPPNNKPRYIPPPGRPSKHPPAPASPVARGRETEARLNTKRDAAGALDPEKIDLTDANETPPMDKQDEGESDATSDESGESDSGSGTDDEKESTTPAENLEIMVRYVHEGNVAGLRSRLAIQTADIEKTAKVHLKAEWAPAGEKRQNIANHLNIFLAAQTERVTIDSKLVGLGVELADLTAKQAAAKAAITDIKKNIEKAAVKKRESDKVVKEQIAMLLVGYASIAKNTGKRQEGG